MSKLTLPKRPKYYPSLTIQYRTGCGSVFVTISVDESGAPVETFINIGKSGGCTQAFAETVGKMTSVGLRCGVGVEEIVSQYSGVQCKGGAWDNGERVNSCPDAVASALKLVAGGLGAKLAMIMSNSVASPGGTLERGEAVELSDEDVQKRVAEQRAEREKVGAG